MAAAHIKQLEEKVARYERIMNECSRCRTALASDEVEDGPPPTAPARASRKNAPKVSSTASIPKSKKPVPTTKKVRSTRSSQQLKHTSRCKPQASNIDVVGPNSTAPASTNRHSETDTGPSQNTERPSGRLSGNTMVQVVLPSSSTQQTFADNSLNIRPTTLRPSKSAIDSLIPVTSQLNSTGPSLSGSDSNARRPRVDPNKQTEWVISADKMLEEVPLGWVWYIMTLQVDKSLLAAVAVDTTAVPAIVGAVDDNQNTDHLLKLVRGFAHRHSVQRVNFQHFLLVCLCIVLSTQGFPQSSIVEILKVCISDTSEKTIDRYLKGAKWMNGILSRLFFTDWRYRAIDLLVLWDRSVAMYGRIVTSTSYPTSDYFVSHLMKPEYCKYVDEIPNRVHSTIPWIVKKELGNEVSYKTICKALGYSAEYISETKHLHSSIQSTPDSHNRSSDNRASASESPAFHSARESADSTSSLTPDPSGLLPSGDIGGAAYLKAWSRLGKQALPRNDHNDSAHKDAAANQMADSQRLGRTTPDRFAQPLGDSTRSPPATQNPKRPLPDSPSSQSQSDDSTTRRQHEGQRQSREENGSSSRLGKKDSHKRRDRG